MNLSLRNLRLFLRLSRPLFLLGGFLVFGLGASIAAYLGRPIDFSLYVAGQALVSAIQLMTHYLNEYFDFPFDTENQNQTPFSGGSGALGPEGLPRQVALYAATVCLTIAATLGGILLVGGSVPIIAWILLLLGFLGAFFYSSPPLRLASSGYGELTTSLLVAGLIPYFAFALQTGEVHRLLVISTTPLIALHMAMMLVFELPDYASDLKHDKRTLMVRIGWRSGMRLHDLAVVFAIASFVIAYFSGFPRRVVMGMIIAFPLALAQIWQMGRIRRGFPPNWRVLTFSAVGLFALVVYLELIGYLLI